ncbi:hypothetical protein BGZ97_009957 [Linnemannia gamsii]|uniref:Beta-lactamase-related domain-containing protein n=1 Tax=Linnemannia gamsii TaxID=64522 RepID=A0A9P6QQL1_9FUNG|nr:hypothetical protein BGZ97_009957 [Linnemannia gamsii]
MPDIDIAWFKNTTPRRELFKTLRHVSPPQKLNSYYEYSNTMYAIAGEAAANVAGTTWEDLVQTKLIDPLGLKNTGFAPSGMVKHSDNYAMPYDAASFKDAQEGRFEKGYLDDILKADAAAGDIYSNVLDLVKWGHVVMTGGVLDGKQVLKKDTGSLFGFRGSLALYPDADIVVAFLTNTHKSALRTYIPFYIVDQLLRLPRTEDWLSNVTIRETQAEYDAFDASKKGSELPARVKGTSLSHADNLEAYAGEYSDPVMGTVTIKLFKDKDSKDKDILTLEYVTYKSRMDHYHYDTFHFALKDFAVDAAVLASFSMGSDGRVSGLSIVAGPNEDDVISFKRRLPEDTAIVKNEE